MGRGCQWEAFKRLTRCDDIFPLPSEQIYVTGWECVKAIKCVTKKYSDCNSNNVYQHILAIPVMSMEETFHSPYYGLSELATLDAPSFLSFLRFIDDITEKRYITNKIYKLKITEWKSSKRFNKSVAAFLYHGIHQPMRESFREVLLLSPVSTVNVALFTLAHNSVYHHHNFVDASVFPKLRQINDTVSIELDILAKDLAGLYALQRRIITGNDHRTLVEYVAALNDHLNRKEMLIVPLLIHGYI